MRLLGMICGALGELLGPLCMILGLILLITAGGRSEDSMIAGAILLLAAAVAFRPFKIKN